RLPNGHCAYLAWRLFTPDEAARVQGGRPGTEHETGIYGEMVRETDADGNVVFEWSNNDPEFLARYPIAPLASREEYGHANTIDVLPNGDFLVSFRVLNLLVIIDRQTGKLKWEYQNDMLGGQHDSHMLQNGNILVFANGYQTPGVLPVGSQVWEIDPATREIVWRYVPKRNPLDFYSPHISGCQRLPNGNTLICEGGKGCLFEVTAEGDLVWQYYSAHFDKHHFVGEMNWIFRAKRYAADSQEIRNRV
ncbi:MAG: arylsulfotransferase family protein, partial [Beijerinckiaceae bacterium]